MTDIRICFIGDSFVNGTGDPLCLGWTGRVCATAIQQGYPLTYYNLGIRRETSADIAARWQDECRRRLPPTSDGRVVVSFGANDTTIEQGRQRLSRDATLHHLRAIVHDARRQYPTLLVGPPPVAEAAHNARIMALCHAIAAVAHELGIPYLPVCEPLLRGQTWVQEAVQWVEHGFLHVVDHDAFFTRLSAEQERYAQYSTTGFLRATPRRLLELVRGQWQIENKSHGVRDVSHRRWLSSGLSWKTK